MKLNISEIFLTIIVGTVSGYLFFKLKVPGGLLIGSIIGVTAVSILFEAAYMPYSAKLAAQITAGAYIGCTVNKKDIRRMKQIYKPALVMLMSYFILNIVLGIAIYMTSNLDLLTALLCAIPGGISDVPLIAVDMGADVPKVVVMQFVRMSVGIGVFPGLIVALDERMKSKCNCDIPNRKEDGRIIYSGESPAQRTTTKEKGFRSFMTTVAAASISGTVGKMTGMPSGTLLFSMLGVLCLKLLTDKAYIPIWAKRAAQILSGAYIGCTIGYDDLCELRFVLIPALIMIVGYMTNSVITGRLLCRLFGFSLKEGMLAATPAGASDMALISADVGIQSPDIIVLHVIRIVFVVAVFPQVINLLVMCFG